MHDRPQNANVLPRDEAEDEAVERALHAAVSDAIRQHQRLGNSVVVVRNGQIIEIPATEIKLDE